MCNSKWMVALFSTLFAVWTFAFTCAQVVSYLHTYLVNILVWGVSLRLLISPHAAVWTCASTWAQLVGYFYIWRKTQFRMNEWLLFPPRYSVNLCICLCSGGKFLLRLLNIVTWDVWLRTCGFSFSTCCCVNLCIHFCLAGKLLSYLVNILTWDVWLRMDGFSFLHLLLCQLVHSLVLSL